jgi:all-trans-nonaprenyl-diphosphate synthase
VQKTSALDRVRRLARDYALRAKECLADLVDSDFRRALMAVPDFVLEREN